MRRAGSHGTLSDMPPDEGRVEGKEKKKSSKDGPERGDLLSPEKESKKKSGRTKPKDTEEFMKFLHTSVNNLSKKRGSETARSSASRGKTLPSKPEKKKKQKETDDNFSMPVLPMDFTEFDDDDGVAREKEAAAFDDPWGNAKGALGGADDFDEFDFDDGFGDAHDNDESETTHSEGFDLHMSRNSEIFIDPSQLSRSTMTPVAPSPKAAEFDGGFDFSPSGVSMGSDKSAPIRGIARSRSTDMSPVMNDEKVRKGGRKAGRLMQSMSTFESSTVSEFTVTKVSSRASPPSSPTRVTEKKSRSRKKKDTVFDTYDWTMS